MSKYILFIDSGLGGLTTLAETIKKQKANYLYFADNKYAPYGEKSDIFIQERLASVVSEFSKKYNVSMVVLACNTATTTSINYLRKKFKNLIFVGTEPALKCACDKHFMYPAVIATPQTLRHLSPSKCNNFTLLPCQKLASLIDNYFLTPSIQNKLLLIKNIYSIKSKLQKNDCLILGCTHYSILKSTFADLFHIEILDGNQGVSSRICSISKIHPAKTSVKIVLSSKKTHELQKYKKILNQILANQINLC